MAFITVINEKHCSTVYEYSFVCFLCPATNLATVQNFEVTPYKRDLWTAINVTLLTRYEDGGGGTSIALGIFNLGFI
jgi:hypothetical protein